MIRSALSATIVMTAALCASATAQDPASIPQGPAPAPSMAPPSGGEKFPWPESATAKSPTNPDTIVGSLAIRAVQGTPGGPAIVSLPIEVTLLHRGSPINTIKTQIDDHGVVVLDNLPVSLGIQPVATIKYADLTYQVAGGLMDPTHPQQQLDLVCYEPTTERPPWTVQMMHVMMSEAGDGLHVTEVIVINNPGDRTWIGDVGTKTKRVTTAFKLPSGAQDVSLGRGFHDWCCTTLANGTLFNHLPLMPDVTEMVFSYTLPMNSGTAALEIVAPAKVDNLMVAVPESLSAKPSEGLQAAGTQAMGGTTMQSFVASNLTQGQQASLTLASMRSEPPAAAASSAESMSKVIAMVVGGFILLLAVAMIVFKAGKNRKPLSNPV